MRRRTALLAATIVAGPAVTKAQSAPAVGPYVSFGGGYSLQQDIFDHPGTSPYRPPSGRYQFGDGYVAAGDVGWGLGNGIRLDLEGLYADSAIKRLAGTGIANATSGSLENYGLFGNIFYDVDLTKLGLNVTAFQPYVGVGVGVLWTRFGPFQSNFINRTVFRSGGTAANFDYQGIVGIGVPIPEVPGLKLSLDYRFIGVQVNSGAVGEYFAAGRESTGTVHLSPAFTHQFTVGATYAFFHPQPPPPPAPAPAPAPVAQPTRTYLVFFDWDRSDLTERARQIIAEAAQASTRVQTTRIEVNGYTDLSGTVRYNQALSVRRARSVEAELVRDGVPAGEIAIRGYGESNPLVPTAQGVREPQNRRVEIILR
jgi:outer membrane protein OmpA-like peptidoglycan-associated protein